MEDPAMTRKDSVLALILLFFLFPNSRTWAQDNPPRLEVGPVFTFLHIPPNGRHGINPQNQAGIGGRLSYNFGRHVGMEAEYSISPFGTPTLTTQYQGGRLGQGFFGVRAGTPWKRWGAFAKLRPGFVSYSNAFVPAQPTGIALGRVTEKAFDVGGVAELYLNRRFLVRYDIGDTLIRYGGTTFHGPSGQAVSSPSFTLGNFRFATAVAVRF
jgi:hypothetical protein